MKILFFIDSLTSGGKERRFTELIKSLSKNSDFSFEIVVMHKEIHYSEILNFNINVHFLIRKSQKDLSVFKRFYKICKNYKPDLVHTWDDMTSIIAVPSCQVLKIKLVNGMVVDTPVKRNFSNKYWFRAQLTFPFSKMIIGNSQAGLNAYGASKNKSQCIYNGMDFNRFKNLKEKELMLHEIFGEIKEPVITIGMIAAFEPRKDYETFIKAAITLLKQNNSLRFLMVGDGSQIDEMKSIVPSQYREKIVFLGRRNDVESIINLIDIGVLLTNTDNHGEGISNSIIEYMALRKPVIATTGGGTNEAIHNNENGFLINNKDKNQFIDRINRLVKDPQLRKIFGEKGYEIAYSKFNLKLMSEKYATLYRKLIA